jgi:AraC-like DNA-binding protein
MVLFITAAFSEATAIQAFRQGARDFFRKPLDLFKLKDVIEKLLKIKGRSSEKRRHQGSGTEGGGPSLLCLPEDMPDNLLRSLHYIKTNFSAQLTIEHLAAQAGISKYHFCRKFKKHAGVSPMSFVTLMRIEKAKGLLGRNIPVSAVAYKVGFNDLGNFIRSFKKVTGQTPSAYKKIDSIS